MRTLPLVPDGEAAVAEEPGDRPFDLPAVSAEPLAGFDSRAGDAWDDAAAAQPPQVLGGVVGLVRAELAGTAPARPAPRPDRGYAQDQRQQSLTVMDVRTRHTERQGQALSVGQDVQLAALLAPVDRIAPGQ